MTLMPAVLDLPVPSNLDTYEQAASFKTNLVWKQLDETSVEEALSYWLPTLSPKTQLSYRSGIKLRASAVTYLKQQGFQDSDIMRVTGHSTSEMVFAYDKSSRADNASKKVNLIS